MSIVSRGSSLTVHNPLFSVHKLRRNKLMQCFYWSITSKWRMLERCARSGPKKKAKTKTYNKEFPNHSIYLIKTGLNLTSNFSDQNNPNLNISVRMSWSISEILNETVQKKLAVVYYARRSREFLNLIISIIIHSCSFFKQYFFLHVLWSVIAAFAHTTSKRKKIPLMDELCAWPVGLVAWFSLRVRVVPGSTPRPARVSYSIFKTPCFISLFLCFK